MEIKQKDEGASLVDFVSALKAYFLKTQGLFAHSWWLSQFFLKRAKRVAPMFEFKKGGL